MIRKPRVIKAAQHPTSIRLCGASEALQLEAAEAAVDGVAPKLRRFTMIAYTGGLLRQYWSEYPIVADLAGMTVGGASLPIYRGHDANRIVAHTDKIEVSAKQIKVAGVMSGAGPDAVEVLALASNGFPWQASIGANIDRLELVERGVKIKVNGQTFVGPVYVARATTLSEISFVPRGEDAASSASIAAHLREGSQMDFAQWLAAKGFDVAAAAALTAAQRTGLQAAFDSEQRPTPPAAPAPVIAAAPPPVENPVAALRAEMAAESQRVGAIRRLCAEAPTVDYVVAGAGADGAAPETRAPLEAHAIAANWSENQTELYILRASRPAAPAIHARSHERDATRQALQGALILRANGRLDHPSYQTPLALAMNLPGWLRAPIDAANRQRTMEAAWQYRDLSLVDLCRESCRIDGRAVPASRSDAIRAAFSGGTLADIFTTNINAVMLATYSDAPDTTSPWTRTVDVADFKLNDRPRLGKGGALKRLPRGGTAEHTTRDAAAESYKIARFSRQFVVDEQDVIDDSMGAFADIPVEMGNAAQRLRPDLVYAILLANANLTATARALFNATDGNLLTGAALASATLKAAIKTIMLFRENGVNLSLLPTHLLVPPSLLHLARELINSATIIIAGTAGSVTERGTINSINADNLFPIADARLENGVTHPNTDIVYAGSASTWFLISAIAHTIEVAYLRGSGRAPQLRSKILDSGQYGIQWDCALDIGGAAMDWRGVVKNTA
jgi:hypothetical protein